MFVGATAKGVPANGCGAKRHFPPWQPSLQCKHTARPPQHCASVCMPACPAQLCLASRVSCVACDACYFAQIRPMHSPVAALVLAVVLAALPAGTLVLALFVYVLPLTNFAFFLLLHVRIHAQHPRYPTVRLQEIISIKRTSAHCFCLEACKLDTTTDTCTCTNSGGPVTVECSNLGLSDVPSQIPSSTATLSVSPHSANCFGI